VPAKSKKLTLKQRKWIKVYIETRNATEAAMQVYDCKSRSVAEKVGSENLGKLGFGDLMEKMGLTDVALLNIGAEGMTKANKIHGTGDSFVEVPDYGVRHRYWETILKLNGKMVGRGGTDTLGVEFKKGDQSVKIIIARGNAKTK